MNDGEADDPLRNVHLIGSIPADDAEQAMREATNRLGNRLRTLPDGVPDDGPRGAAGLSPAPGRQRRSLVSGRPGAWAPGAQSRSRSSSRSSAVIFSAWASSSSRSSSPRR